MKIVKVVKAMIEERVRQAEHRQAMRQLLALSNAEPSETTAELAVQPVMCYNINSTGERSV